MKQLLQELGIGDWKAKHFAIAFYVALSIILAAGITDGCPAILMLAVILNLINAVRLAIKYPHIIKSSNNGRN